MQNAMLKMALASAVVLSATPLAGGAALAQSSPNPAAFRTTEIPNQSAGTWDELNRRTMGKPRMTVTAKQLDRANRVAGLINKGQCSDAYQLAVDEHDNKLAARVTEVCTPKS